MAATLAPLASTQRVVDWDELPSSVRDIPKDFSPLDDGVLMAHQAAWCALDAVIKVAEKGRRTGITFAEALDDTITAASRTSAGGDDIYYVGDTKEKGLEFVGYCASFARVIAEAQGQGVSGIEEFLFEDQDSEGTTRHINAYRIRFASGHQIVALSSRPANIRGLQGIVVIDEAAFHQNVEAVIEAATALLIWGGRIRIISTHNTTRNPYNQLLKDVREGRYGQDAKTFKVTFDDAVANGLYERVCLMRRDTPTAEGKKRWYQRIRSAYGPRTAAMREELDAIPREGGGTAVPGIWIEQAMPIEDPPRPVLRLVLDEQFAHRSEDERRGWCSAWIETNLDPVLARLDRDRRHVFGQDFARHRDFSVIMPAALTASLSRSVPFVIEMQNVPARQQEQILWHTIDALPRFSGGAMDATGSGQTLAEYTADRYGRPLIQEVTLNRAWYAEWMPKFVGAFEDGVILLPRDENIEADLRAIEYVDGIPMVAKARRKDLKEPELYRHGDSASAGGLMWYASANRSAPIEYRVAPSKSARWDGEETGDDMFDDLPSMETGAW